MPVPLRIVERPWGSPYETKAGDTWPCWNTDGSHTVEGRGPCWVVRLPGGAAWFHTNMEASGGGYWDVSGEAPNLTVHPSINVGPEIWHGWITNGQLDPETDRDGKR